MNSFNPFGMFMNLMGGNGTNMNMNNNPMMQMMNMMSGKKKSSQNIPINQQQFKQFLPNIVDNILQQLVQQAKNQGMSNDDIQAGINFINQLR